MNPRNRGPLGQHYPKRHPDHSLRPCVSERAASDWCAWTTFSVGAYGPFSSDPAKRSSGVAEHRSHVLVAWIELMAYMPGNRLMQGRHRHRATQDLQRQRRCHQLRQSLLYGRNERRSQQHENRREKASHRRCDLQVQLLDLPRMLDQRLDARPQAHENVR